MRLLHLSEDGFFEPAAIEAVPGFGPGCFFYLAPTTKDELQAHIRAWAYRYPSFWEAPDSIVEVVQNFLAWEVGNPFEIVELFVAAVNLSLLRKSCFQYNDN